MSLDPKILRRSREILEAEKALRAQELEERRRAVFEELPRLSELDRLIKNTVIEAVSQAFKTGEDPLPELRRIQAKNLDLQAERAEILVSAGYPIDYLDDFPSCRICEDSGYVGSSPCSCLMTIYRREQIAELSSLLKLGEESFDTFDLDLYDDEFSGDMELTPRKNMNFIYDFCVMYARRFSPKSPNLFFTGGPGLGKTFLSACMAKEISQNGYSAVYDGADKIFSTFEDDKFSRGDETSRSDIKRYLTCDLLIMDDLGAEMATSFVTSALYTIINTRLTFRRPTIISSNLSEPELSRRYSPQVASRILGEYLTLSFYGKDIRLKKKKK